MSKMDAGRLDDLLDWLSDEVAGRLRARQEETVPPPPAPPAPPVPEETTSPLAQLLTARAAAPEGLPQPEPEEPDEAVSEPDIEDGETDLPDHEVIPVREEQNVNPEPILESASDIGYRSHAALLMKRMAIGLLVAVVLINIPLDARGKSLARALPTYMGVAVYSGVLVKEVDKPEVYVYEAGAFHWIVDPDAFEGLGYRWENVHNVSSGFLADFFVGKPRYRVVKCSSSPHIYGLQDGAKRWIIDIPTFEAEGIVWDDVEMVDCGWLRSLAAGETIPAGYGPAPEP